MSLLKFEAADECLLLLWGFTFFIIFIHFITHIHIACTYVCVPHEYLVPTEVERGHQISWN